jgi:hypothetical protein
MDSAAVCRSACFQEPPYDIVERLKESRLMILDIFMRINMFLFRFNNNFYGAFRADINLTTCALSTVH